MAWRRAEESPKGLASLPVLDPKLFTIAEELLESIRRSPAARRNSRNFAQAHVRIRIA